MSHGANEDMMMHLKAPLIKHKSMREALREEGIELPYQDPALKYQSDEFIGSANMYINNYADEERGNGKWIGKTSQPCPPSSSTNDSERLQKISEGAQSIHNHRTEDGRSRGQRFISLRPHKCPLAVSLQSDEPAQHHQICSQPSTQAGYVQAEPNRTVCDRSPRFSPRQMSAAVMLPAIQIRASSAETGRDGGGGGWGGAEKI
ncbi:hypothetical protein PAMA_019301 [Pampus argenteus]